MLPNRKNSHSRNKDFLQGYSDVINDTVQNGYNLIPVLTNECQSYSIKWADILGHDKEAEIFFGNAHNLRGKKLTQNLRHVAEDYQNELARQIHDKVNELNSHHQKNVKLHGSTLWNVAASNGKESAEK